MFTGVTSLPTLQYGQDEYLLRLFYYYIIILVSAGHFCLCAIF